MYRKFETKFWIDPFVEKLTCAQKLVYIYLFTSCPTLSGIFEISEKRIANEVGVTIGEVREALDILEEHEKIFRQGDYIILNNFLKYQASKSPKVLKKIEKELAEIAHKTELIRFFKDTVWFMHMEVKGVDFPLDMRLVEKFEEKFGGVKKERRDEPEIRPANKEEKTQQPLVESVNTEEESVKSFVEENQEKNVIDVEPVKAESSSEESADKSAAKATVTLTSPSASTSSSAQTSNKNCPVQKIVDLWNTLVTRNNSELKPVKKVSTGTKRHRHLLARWRENPSLGDWERVFNNATLSDFLNGRVTGSRGKPFFASFDWIIQSADNFNKVWEGQYNNRKPVLDKEKKIEMEVGKTGYHNLSVIAYATGQEVPTDVSQVTRLVSSQR